MMKKFPIFVVRWAFCSLGLWISLRLFGTIDTSSGATTLATFLFAGLIFSLINTVLKPILTILSLPFVLVTLGLFMLVVNGFLVWLTVAIAPNIHMEFWPAAIISGIVLSLVNYMVSGANELLRPEEGAK